MASRTLRIPGSESGKDVDETGITSPGIAVHLADAECFVIFARNLIGSQVDLALALASGDEFVDMAGGVIVGMSAVATGTPPVGGTADLDLWLNGVDKGADLTVQLNSGARIASSTAGTPVSYSAGQTLQVKASTNLTWTTRVVLCFLFIKRRTAVASP